MTIIRYLGPGGSVMVHPYGRHAKDQEKEYPDDFATELLATSRRQRFEVVEGGGIADAEKDPKEMTVPELTELLEKLGIEIPAKAKKADLLRLLETHTAEPPKEE